MKVLSLLQGKFDIGVSKTRLTFCNVGNDDCFGFQNDLINLAVSLFSKIWVHILL